MTKKSDIAQYFLQEDATFTVPSRDLLMQYGDIRFALLYSTIFSPDFIEVEGSILVKDNTDDMEGRFSTAKKDTTMTLAALEASFNFVEIGYIFRTDDGITDDAIEAKLAHIMQDAWSDKLKRLYPSRIFQSLFWNPALVAASIVWSSSKSDNSWMRREKLWHSR